MGFGPISESSVRCEPAIASPAQTSTEMPAQAAKPRMPGAAHSTSAAPRGHPRPTIRRSASSLGCSAAVSRRSAGTSASDAARIVSATRRPSRRNAIPAIAVSTTQISTLMPITGALRGPTSARRSCRSKT